MGVNIKSFQQILKGMVDWTAQNSSRLIDFSVGSVIRTFYEAIASELEEFYYRIYQNFQWAIENAVYESFSFTKQPALPAYGDLLLAFTNALPSNLSLPAGTQFIAKLNDGSALTFVTQQDYTINAGSTQATITVYCTKPGTVGNVAANTITQMMSPNVYIASVTNPQKFLTGKDEETDAERKARFAKYVQTRSKGTKQALEYGTMEVLGVAGVYVDDSQIGVVKVYAYDAYGNLPDNLKTQIQTNLDNYRPAGIPIVVLPIVKITQDVSVTLTLDPLYSNQTFVQYIQDNITNYLNSFTSGESLLLSNLNAYIRELDTQGIKNCTITTPNNDVTVQPFQLIRPGNVNITVMTQ